MTDQLLELFSQSYFAYPLAACSFIGVAVIIHRSLALRSGHIIPGRLSRLVADDEATTDRQSLRTQFVQKATSPFGKIILAATGPHPSRNAAENATQVIAREELVKMQRGLTTLEVIIAIAPLLGLLGTVSGLVHVFSATDNTASKEGIARGISEALWTTILGLSIAVPAVIAHGFFHRRIEKLAARMEVLAQNLILRIHPS